MKYYITYIISDSAPLANSFGLGRKINVLCESFKNAVILANKVHFIVTGDRDNFLPKALKPCDYATYSSACGNYHVELWRDGITFDDVKDSSANRRKFEKGNNNEHSIRLFQRPAVKN